MPYTLEILKQPEVGEVVSCAACQPSKMVSEKVVLACDPVHNGKLLPLHLTAACY